jgi:L-asparaginase
VVVTHGTDTLEETAMLCDVLYGGDCPIVFTGAIRPASAPGADGPANLADAVALAGSVAATGLGVGRRLRGSRARRAGRAQGRLHRRRAVRLAPRRARSGVVHEGRVNIGAFPVRRPADRARAPDLRVPIVSSWLGDDGELLRSVAASDAAGCVVETLGAGHLGPRALAALRAVAERMPVVATTRPGRGSILYETYGFEGCEADVRAVAIAAGALSPQAARMKLLACLGAGLDRGEIALAFLPDDA